MPARNKLRQTSACDLEFVALDLGQIDALDADQAGLGLAPRRMNVAFVVNMRLAGR
jgi:hypothetical protein